MESKNSFFMNLIIREAWKNQGLTYPNPAVSSAVVNTNNELVSLASHSKVGEAHAEVLAIRDAYTTLTKDEIIKNETNSEILHDYLTKHHKNIFKNFTIYVTLEPCNHYGKTPPCSLLIHRMGFRKVVIGSKDENQIATGGANYLSENSTIVLFCNDKKQEANHLIEPFNRWHNDKFIFFKYASTLNGNVTDGVISSIESREYVHKLRDKIDLLVIGGETVRYDRPTLDTRLIPNGKNPDILIYSQKDKSEFDYSIPLFSVPNRKVFISDSLDILESYNFIMFEGGEKMLNIISDSDEVNIDYFLIFMSPVLNNLENMKLENKLELEFLNIEAIGKDIKIWAKKV